MTDKHHRAYVQIGLNILRCRKERGLTQEKLAEKIGYSPQQLQRVETAAAAPTVAILLDLSEALEVPLERLLEMRD